MSKITCYNPVKGVDNVIAAQVPSWNSKYVATLRGLYKDSKGVDTTDVKELVKFRSELSAKDAKRLADAITNPIAAYDQLRGAFTTRERIDRVNMIANVFSDVLDSLQENNPQVDRETIITGFIDQNGNFQGGPAYIYNEVYKTLKANMDEDAENGYSENVEKYRQVFKNWAALVTYANTVIRDTEGFKIGAGLTFADKADMTDYDESAAVESFVADESTKEAWQEVSDSISPFGSASIPVRRLLGRLSGYTSDNEEDYDDLGYLRRMPVTQMHQSLMEILRGMQSESDMMELLRRNEGSRPYISSIFEEFKRDPILRTQFFVDFSKSFQLYSMETSKNNGGVYEYKNQILNLLTRKKAFRRYSAQLATQSLDASNAIFRYSSLGAEVDPVKALALANYIKGVIGTDSDSGNIFNKPSDRLTKDDRIDLLKTVLPQLGITLSDAGYYSIAADRTAMNEMLKSIRDLPLILGRAKKGMDFRTLMNIRVGSQAKEGYLAEKIGKMFKVVESVDSERKVLSRVRFNDNTYYSDVQSSYLGRFMDRIKALSKNGDIEGLRKFIMEQYCSDLFFYDKANGRIRNRWLHDLWFSNLDSDNSFADRIAYKKLLGDNIQKVDDFTSRKQAVNMVNEYFSETKDYAWYPVFVLGDSGASKWIRAKRYSSQDIIDGLYDVFLQERELQRGLKELKESLTRAGKSLGSLERIDDNRYSMLTFLNDSRYSGMIDMSNIEQSVKNTIRKYMSDSFTEYLDNMRSVGALQVNSNGKYKYLNKLTTKTVPNGVTLKGRDAVEANLMEYFYNSKFATIMQMQLMTISPAFYSNGDVTDLQKRYKETHASGNRLSLDAVNPATGRKYSDRSYQTVMYFNDVKANPEYTDPEFMEVIKSLYGENSDIYKQYRDKTSFTDGQGYRTLKSYRAVMGMSGKWNAKCEYAYNRIEEIRSDIRDNGGNVTDDQMREINSLMVTLQPIKPFYYSLENMFLQDADGNESVFHVPVQMKYAEIVVIPELMPKGSRLRDMMEAAEKRDIDLVAATSAVKVGSFGSIDVDSATDAKGIEDAFDSGYIHKLDWNDFVIQNNVPEHVMESRLFATQSRKIIFSNLRKTDDKGNTLYYDSYTGGKKVNLGGKESVRLNAYNLNRFFVSLIATNILEDFDSYSSMMKDPNKVRDILVQMTLNNSRETKDNLRGYGKGVEHDFLMPLFEGGIEHDTAALLLSVFKKKVNKQKIAGGCAVQASAYGLTGYEENNNLHFVRDPHNPTNILYAECEMAWDLNFTDSNGRKVELEFSDWCNADGTLKLDEDGEPRLEKKFPGITSFIAYRIPTEEKYSMLNMKVVRFTPKVNGGGTIKVPAQGTTIAGFDFDIDKLYFMRREYVVKRSDKVNEEATALMQSIFGESSSTNVADLFDIHDFEEYDYDLAPWDKSQSRAARNNMIITLMQHRLADPQTIRERTTPGGFEHAKKASRYIKGLMGIDDSGYDFSDPWTMVRFTQQNQVAGKLIGIFANQNTNTAMASLMQEFVLKNPIAFGNHPQGLGNLLNPDALTKELLAASVDAVKEPVLNFLNLNTITADSAGMLCRLGYSFEEIGLLMNQPIIRELCDYVMDNNMADIDTAMNNMLESWGVKGNHSELDSSKLTVSALEKGITDFRDNPDIRTDASFIAKQAQVMELFRSVYASAKELSSFVTNTKFTASNAVKSTFGGMYEQQDKVRKYVESVNSKTSRLFIKVADLVDSPIDTGMNMSDREGYITEVMKNPFGYEQVMYDCNKQALKELERYFPYGNPTYTTVREFMSGLTRSGLDAKSIDAIHESMLRYMAGLDKFSPFNPDYVVDVNGKAVTMREYFTRYVPLKVADLLNRNPELRSIPIFSLMMPVEDSNHNVILSLMDNGALTPPQKEDIRESWELLLTDPELSKVAKDLYMYSYYMDGFGFGVTGFNHLAPLELKLNMPMDGSRSYVGFLNDVLEDNIEVNEVRFARRFIQEHRDNSRFVYTPKSRQYELIKKFVYSNGVAVDRFTLDYTGNPERMKPFTLKATKEMTLFKPAIMVDGILYMANGERLNQSYDGTMEYVRVKDDVSSDISMSDVLAERGEAVDDSTTSVETEDIVDLDSLTIEDVLNRFVDASILGNRVTKEQGNEDREDTLKMIRQMDENERKENRETLVRQLVELYKEQGVHCKSNGKHIC